MKITGKCISCSKRTQGRKSNSSFICRKCKLIKESEDKLQLLKNLCLFDFGWLVGIIEGEGCFYCKKSKCKLKDGVYCYPLSGFTVMSTDHDVMIKVSNLLELRLNGPYYSEEKRKKVWSIQVTGNIVTVIMKYFYSQLSKRRQKQIDEAIEWQSRKRFKCSH